MNSGLSLSTQSFPALLRGSREIPPLVCRKGCHPCWQDNSQATITGPPFSPRKYVTSVLVPTSADEPGCCFHGTHDQCNARCQNLVTSLSVRMHRSRPSLHVAKSISLLSNSISSVLRHRRTMLVHLQVKQPTIYMPRLLRGRHTL
jgi:hypothetical protein